MNKYLWLIIAVVIIIGGGIVLLGNPWKRNPEKISCAVTGGEWRREGLAGVFRCVHKYADAGKPCQSSDECLGGCIVLSYNSPAQCKSDDSPFGCFTTIENFKKGPPSLGDPLAGAILCTD